MRSTAWNFAFLILLLLRPAMEAVAAETQPRDATAVPDGSASGLVMRRSIWLKLKHLAWSMKYLTESASL